MKLLKRLMWDFAGFEERKYYVYWLIWQIPGLFGNELRGRYLSGKLKRAGSGLTVSPGTRFRSMENLIVGDNVHIGHDNFIQALGGITVGNDVMTGPGVKIWSANHSSAADQLIREQQLIKREVIIGNDVWIASNAFVLPGVKLPDGIVVGAGSVVTPRPYEAYSIIAGNPAVVISERPGRMSRPNKAKTDLK